MKRVLINGLKSKTGGGRSIFNNYLTLLKESPGPFQYYVLTPSMADYEKYKTDRVHIVDVPRIFNHGLAFPVLYILVIPYFLKRYSIDIIFNLGTVVIPTRVRQLYLYDWPYAVYPESMVWGRMGILERLLRVIRLSFFRLWIKRATLVSAQTEVTSERLKRLYGLQNIEIVPNAVSLENLEAPFTKSFSLPDGKNFLCLTYYYPHKNLEVLLPLAQKIRALGLGYHIVVTLHPKQGRMAAEFLKKVRDEKLEGVIVNIGPVDMKDVPSLYRQCDGLLLPTLLESFSGTYVEAMFHQIPVFTSDLDFAHAVCGDCAWYFDPLDPDDILRTIELAYEQEDERLSRIEKGRHRVLNMPDWPKTFARFQHLLTCLADMPRDSSTAGKFQRP